MYNTDVAYIHKLLRFLLLSYRKGQSANLATLRRSELGDQAVPFGSFKKEKPASGRRVVKQMRRRASFLDPDIVERLQESADCMDNMDRPFYREVEYEPCVCAIAREFSFPFTGTLAKGCLIWQKGIDVEDDPVGLCLGISGLTNDPEGLKDHVFGLDDDASLSLAHSTYLLQRHMPLVSDEAAAGLGAVGLSSTVRTDDCLFLFHNRLLLLEGSMALVLIVPFSFGKLQKTVYDTKLF